MNYLFFAMYAARVGSLNGIVIFFILQNSSNKKQFLHNLAAVVAGVFFCFLTDKIAKFVREMRKNDHQETPMTNDIEMDTRESTSEREESVQQPQLLSSIVVDVLRSFFEGFVIGTSCTEPLRGFSVSVGVLCAEFPSELSDLTILSNVAVSKKKTFLYNLPSVLTCYIGFFFGVFVANLVETSLTPVFAGGMFLYISFVFMIPKMKRAMEEALTMSLSQGLKVLALQAFGVLTGLSVMFFMAFYGESIKNVFEF